MDLPESLREKASLCGQLRDVLADLAAVDGLRVELRRDVIRYVDPGTGDVLSAGELLARMERDVRDGRRLAGAARDQGGEGDEQAAGEGGGAAGHGSTITPPAPTRELAR